MFYINESCWALSDVQQSKICNKGFYFLHLLILVSAVHEVERVKA